MKGFYKKGDRIYLDQVKIKDAKKLVSYFNESSHLLGVSRATMNLKQEKDFIRQQNISSDRYFFAIRLMSNNEIIGSTSLFNINIKDGHAETGTLIGEKFTNKGYGTETKHLLLDWVFNVLKLRKVYSRVYAYNPRSKAYSIKCGYILEATLKERILYKGKYWDEWYFSINKKQWEKHNNHM